jgi:ribosome-associated protein
MCYHCLTGPEHYLGLLQASRSRCKNDSFPTNVTHKNVEEISLNTLALAHTIIDILDEKQAENILLLDIADLAPFADYFIIATATSERQGEALVNAVVSTLRDMREKPMFVEGVSGSGWQLIDYGSVIVHIFSAEQRAFYRLEELWKDAKVIVRMQ